MLGHALMKQLGSRTWMSADVSELAIETAPRLPERPERQVEELF
jgi:hypothetical protein